MTGDEIRKLRTDRKMSQRELGELLGIEQATVSRLENGEWEPSGPVKKLLEMMSHSKTYPREGEAAA